MIKADNCFLVSARLSHERQGWKGKKLNRPAKTRFPLVNIKLPIALTFAGLLSGLLFGIAVSGIGLADIINSWIEPVGDLWLRALQMTIIPLIAALLVLGTAQLTAAAKAGAAAKRMLLFIFVVLVLGGVFSAVATPKLLTVFPIPIDPSIFLEGMPDRLQQIPSLPDFLTSLFAPNIIAAAAQSAMLPLTVFFLVFALAVTQLPDAQNQILLSFFHALANSMLKIIGWVLSMAPIGVFSLAAAVSIKAGGGAFTALTHYILIVSSMGVAVLFGAYLIALIFARVDFYSFVSSALPAQTVAVSTQSSLASLPAMLDSAERLGIKQSISEFVLPLAVAIFRATSPAMNFAVVVYVAYLTGTEISYATIIAGLGTAFIISIGSVSLPGSISFVVSTGPIALAMGVPLEPLALLVAVEMLPDIVRTVGNVTMNLAITSAVDRLER